MKAEITDSDGHTHSFEADYIRRDGDWLYVEKLYRVTRSYDRQSLSQGTPVYESIQSNHPFEAAPTLDHAVKLPVGLFFRPISAVLVKDKDTETCAE